MTKNNPKTHYGSLVVMSGLSFVTMYMFMYAMVDSVGNIYANVNQFYMAALMTAPMIIFELLLMSSMYRNKRLNAIIMGACVIVLIVAYGFIRKQTLVNDRQFLRSMIPHHAGAILMCGQASLRDHEITTLCKAIESSQQAEIEQMKAILRRLQY